MPDPANNTAKTWKSNEMLGRRNG